ncbi:Ubiquitin carboxyl-terminal hydrolase 4 [Lachnellula cervina]|uniref:Ubiquitin carboxyl-terminal hydrolase 4 n=1 Tax=Lachnellula cervina TaxID=1316786 RepID=A0A7D8US19_9HELO|nr:Ubiquitin carboxyl-terminal hydrolase 4 [Lachnellula cervina]
MSPAALGGPPHSRASSLYGAGPISTENGRKYNGLDTMGGVNRVFPHLEELVSVRPDVNPQSPLRTILERGEQFAKSADTNLDFRRPDLALQEYIKASIIAVDIVPRHKDYPSIQNDRGDLHRLYQGLTKRIRTQHQKFDDVKKVIKENNARNGVKAPSAGSLNSSRNLNSHARAQSVETASVNGNSSYGLQNGGQVRASDHPVTPPKKKPPIQPKPNGLHGNAIQPDLAARFARLRSPESNGVIQDPRIRTQPISIPDHSELTPNPPIPPQSINRPTGPREMPSVPTTLPRPKLLPLDLPSMPRAPDPIYNSPARNTDTTSTANLPSSVPRSSSYTSNGRKIYAPPISTVRGTPLLVDDRQDYFTPAHSVNGFSAPPKIKRPDINIPNSTTIKAEDLYEYLKIGSQALRVLLVDLRVRAQFDSGHIMSQTIICIEPMSLRQGVSGDELEERLILGPDSEQALYSKRHEFDLVVFYDQSSSSFDSSISSGDVSNNDLRNFSAAVYDYGYEKRLKRRPMLLVGGLDAWIDLLGQNSLQASSSGLRSTVTSIKPARPLGRVAVNRGSRKPPLVPRRIESRPFTKDEETKWDEVLRNDETVGSPAVAPDVESDNLYYARTTDDFMRRFPEVSTIQESMISGDKTTLVESPLTEEFPTPPARPPPALPRQRSSGVSERGSVTYTPAHAATTIEVPRKPPGLTGLHNPGNLCYMNSTIQMLATIPFLRNYVLNSEYPPKQRIPRKGTELSDPPQIMVRNLKNVFSYMWMGSYDWVTPKTFARYVNALHVGTSPNGTPRGHAFGGTRQHDATEFLIFMTEVLEDETNPNRAVIEPRGTQAQMDEEEKQMLKLPRFVAAQVAWMAEKRQYDSPISRHMKGQFGYFKQCTQCGHETRQFTSFNQVECVIPRDSAGRAPVQGRLDEWLRQEYGEEPDVVYANCDNCKAQQRPRWENLARRSQVYMTYLPDYLVINIKKFDFVGDTRKVDTYVELPEGQFDLGDIFLPDEPHHGHMGQPALERGQAGPFKYEVIAVVHHIGASANQGHYWTVARHVDVAGISSTWHKFDDATVTRANFNQVQGKTAYVVVLRRTKTNDST